MRTTRRTRIPPTEDDDAAVASASRSSSNAGADRRCKRNEPRQTRGKGRRKLQQLHDDEEEESEEESEEVEDDVEEEEEEEEESEEEEEKVVEDAKPIGDAVRVTGKGRWKTNHFSAFEFDGNSFALEDPVLLTPEGEKQKPYVAIIKDITQSTKDGSMMINGQWFYRPEEAEKKGGRNWQTRDTRELFYSFHRDEVPAESVMHKCVVHFVPLHKQLPKRKRFPGFIVQKVYDTDQRKLFKLTDKDYEDSKQHEIDLLVNKTMARLGHLPDLDAEDTPPLDQEEVVKSKKLLRKRNLSPDVSMEDEGEDHSDQHLKIETPVNASKYYTILANYNALTKETPRDKWLEKLLQSVEYVCSPSDIMQEDKETSGAVDSNNFNGDKPQISGEVQDKGVKVDNEFTWPDSAVLAVTALERASDEALFMDFTKYNQKLRQLVFNLKNTPRLTRRLLKGELEPSAILNMSPNELKEGLTAEEIAINQPEEAARMQMTDARCTRCMEKTVGLVDIIQAGHGDRYQLECSACGNMWYASRDEASTLTIDGPSTVKSVGTAPWTTTKFESVEKRKLGNPHDTEKSNALKKSTEASMPVLEIQKSFNKPEPPDDTTTTSVSPQNPE